MRKSPAKLWLVVAGLIIIGGLVGYNLVNGLQPLSLEVQIGAAEQHWQAQHITSYRIQIQHVASIWHLQRYTITLRDGAVVDQSASCIPAPFEGRECSVQPFAAKDYTVAGLFETARSLAKSARGGVTITFDPTYGFPASIDSTPSNLVDADQSWKVLSFEVLN